MTTATVDASALLVPHPGPSAKVIADSIYEGGPRLTTVEVCLHRYMLPELNTHRVISKSSASSRAIPVWKQIDMLKKALAEPVEWASEQKGMQGGEEIEQAAQAQAVWRKAAAEAIERAEELVALKVHKSVVNRVLEPFMMHTVLMTATAWSNFFALRVNPLAQPEIRAAAIAIQAAYDASTPRVLTEGQWHLPYVSDEEIAQYDVRNLVQIGVARSARLSYLTQDGERDVESEYGLYERLTEADPMHAVPLEHVATPAADNSHEVTYEARITSSGEILPKRTLTLPRYGNFLGWHQHRFDVEAEIGYQSFA